MLPTFTMTNIIRSVTTLLAVCSLSIAFIWLFTTIALAQINTTPPTLTLTATAATGGGTTIVWTASNAATCIASQGNPGWAGVKSATGGSQVVTPTVTTLFAMECWSTNGFTSGTKQMYVSPGGVSSPVTTTGSTLTPTSPGVVTTTTDNSATLALINQLLAQVASLQQQLNALQQGTTSNTTGSPITTLTQNLSLGSRGPEVTALQSILASLGYLADENISGYFGVITEAAVKKFQCDKKIVCTGTLSTTGYGGVGPMTRAALTAAIGTSGTTPTCPAGTIWNGVSCVSTTATPTTPTCSTGTYWNGSACVGTVGGGTTAGPSATLSFKPTLGDTVAHGGNPTCVVPAGAVSCAILASWTSRNADGATFYTGDPNSSRQPTTYSALNGSYQVQSLSPSTGNGLRSRLLVTSASGEKEYVNYLKAVCATGSTWNGSICAAGTISTAPAPTAKLTFTFDSVTGGTATSRTTSKTINEKCYIQPGKSNCSVTTSWTTQNATHAVLTFPDLITDYPDLDLYNDPRFRTEGLTGSRTMRLERRLATPHPGYNIGGLRETLILNNSADGQSETYSITLTAVCADGEWDRTKGVCPATTTTTPTPVEPTPEPTPAPSTAPTASLTISPTGTIIYPTVVTYKLSSTNAQSCSIVGSDGLTYVAPGDNLTNKTITSITTPQTTVFTTTCWAEQNGSGEMSNASTMAVVVKCPTNTVWDGSVCK